MNELLQSIKADLLSRQMLPLLAVAAVALVGALAYVGLSGGSEAKPPAPAPAAPVSSGLPVSIAPPNTTAAAAAETPAGIQYETQGPTRDPFSSPPAASGGASSSSSAASSTSKSTTGGSGSPGSGSSSPGGKPSGPSSGGKGPGSPKPSSPANKPAAPKHPAPAPAPKPQVVPFYSVSVLFGPAPANPSEQPALTPYEEMKRFEPLPSAKDARIVFDGVAVVKGKRLALFALIAAPILYGQASCYPSDTHCQWIELAEGKSEELEYIAPSGQTAAFDLKVVKVVKRSSPAGASQAKALRISKAGHRALLGAGLSPLEGVA